MELMDLTDEQLAGQPVGYWTGEAHAAVIAFINAEQGKLGVTQRHWMTLNRLAIVEGGLTREGLAEALGRYMTPQIGDVSTYGVVLDDLVDRGWITPGPDGRLTLTEAGHAGRAELLAIAPGVRDRIHEGIPDEEYVLALKVLRRMIANVSG
ncbi:MarR family winged helix-turn-helix transcriptional regulator [Kitasatospora herbaricolor]|uniref:MarR family winged helix-turn-helix transcriptional regulator n=1 Tax=Kitasatospora herbaricolor TaxID=68217 RepID=UPI0036D88AC0